MVALNGLELSEMEAQRETAQVGVEVGDSLLEE